MTCAVDEFEEGRLPVTTHEDLTEFETWARESLQRSASHDRTKALVADGRRGDEVLRGDLAELGMLGVHVPEEFSGLDASPLMLQALLRQTGAVLLPVGLLSGCIVAPFLVRAAQGEDELLTGIANGSARVAWADADTAAPATLIDGSLTGSKMRVLDADTADTLIVTVGSGNAAQLCVLDAAHAVVDPREPLDPTRPALSVTFDAAPARVLLVDDVVATLEQARLLQTFGLAAESAGLAKATLDMSVTYAKTREQFGRPIGSFQAVKHRCADMFVAAEGASAGVELAARGWEERGELSEFDVLAVASYAFRAARENAHSMMQIHGGLAFAWEHDAHWFLKRATSTPLIAHGVDDSAVADLATEPDFDIVDALFDG